MSSVWNAGQRRAFQRERETTSVRQQTCRYKISVPDGSVFEVRLGPYGSAMFPCLCILQGKRYELLILCASAGKLHSTVWWLFASEGDFVELCDSGKGLAGSLLNHVLDHFTGIACWRL
jgi:hypothetical protein